MNSSLALGDPSIHVGNRKRETINPQVDIEPRLDDDGPLQVYGYMAVRRSPKGEFLDAVSFRTIQSECVAAAGSEAEEIRAFYPLVRIARVTVREDD